MSNYQEIKAQNRVSCNVNVMCWSGKATGVRKAFRPLCVPILDPAMICTRVLTSDMTALWGSTERGSRALIHGYTCIMGSYYGSIS